MKKLRLVFCISVSFLILPHAKASAQDLITIIIQQGIKKVIVAVDLKIQRLQNKVIWLQNVQRVVENAMSKLQLADIAGWVEKQRNLYQDYFDELWEVKDVVSYCHKVKEITDRQMLLVKEYKRAWKGIQGDKHFSPEEVGHMGKVYTGILEESLKNLDDVILVLQSFSLQMADAKRLELIDAAAGAVEQNYNDLRAFSDQNMQLSLQRAKDAGEIAVVKKLYGM